MEGLLERAAFAVAGTDYRWADIIAAARHSGAWERLEEELRQGIACQRWASDTNVRLAAGDVWGEATFFRYQRRLTSAEETEAWLARWHLSKDEWLDCLRRSLLRQRKAADLTAIADRYPVTDQEVAAAAWAAGVCSGQLEQFARDLAARAVAMDVSGAPVPDGGVDGRFDELEAAFQDWCERVKSPTAIRKTIASRHLEWMRLDCRWASFLTAEAAREALMCVRVDGVDLAEVSALAGTTVTERRFFVEESEPALRDKLVAAIHGDLLGPLPSANAFGVMEVTRKTLPSRDDPAIVERAKSAVVADAIRQELANRVRWYDPL